MGMLFLIERTDADNERCWGQNLAMVVNVSNRSEAEALAFKHLVTGDDGNINVMTNGKILTKDYVQYTDLGDASPNVKAGVLLIQNAGA